jgi:hypothetical protein
LPLRSLLVPKRTQEAVSSLLASHSRFFAKNPQVRVNHEDLSTENIREALPVYVVKVPPRPGARRSRKLQNESWFKPRRIAWRFFLETKQGVNVAVEFHIGRVVKSYHQLQHGEFIQHTFDSLGRAMRNERVQRQPHSVCILHVPALYFSALWFKGGRDLFVPLVSFPGWLRSGHFYTRAEVVRALANKTSERRKAHERLLARRAQSKASRPVESSENGSPR